MIASIHLAKRDDSFRVPVANAVGRAGHLVTSCSNDEDALAALQTRE